VPKTKKRDPVTLVQSMVFSVGSVGVRASFSAPGLEMAIIGQLGRNPGLGIGNCKFTFGFCHFT